MTKVKYKCQDCKKMTNTINLTNSPKGFVCGRCLKKGTVRMPYLTKAGWGSPEVAYAMETIGEDDDDFIIEEDLEDEN